MESWKIEKDLCRCCHSEGSFRALSELCTIGGEEGYYSDMLRLTLNIHLKPVDGQLETHTYTICDSCVLRVRDATSFRQQVLLCEERFQDMYNKGVIKLEVPVIKQEEPDSEDDRMDSGDLDDGHDTFEPDDVIDSSDPAVKLDLEICKADPEPEPIDTKRRSTRTKKASVKPQEKAKTKSKAKKTKVKPETSGEGEEGAKKDARPWDHLADFTALSRDGLSTYICNQCGLSLQTVESIQAHIKTEHMTKLVCYMCKKTYKSEGRRNKHLTNCHGAKEVKIEYEKFKCDICNKNFSTKKSVRRHVREYHLLRKCPDCPIQLLKKELARHRSYVHGMAMPTCELCGYKTLSRYNMIKHQSSHLTTCNICKKEFPTKKKLIYHNMNHHKPVKCPDCPMEFSKEELLRHRAEVHGRTIPTCGVCGYKNTNQYRIDHHQRLVHLKEKHVSCAHCEFKCYNYSLLRRHMVKHDPVKKFECSYCKKKFPRSAALSAHEKIHTGDKRKVCKICEARFVQKASLNYHMAKHHPDAYTDESEAINNFTTLVQDDKRSFSCNTCGMIFNGVYSVQNHIKKEHLKRYNFPCYICNETFKAQGPRHKHLLKSHGMEEVMVAGKYTAKSAQKVACDVCKKEFPAKFCLLKHMHYHKTFKCPDCSAELLKDDLTRHRAEVHGVEMPTCGVCGYRNSSEWRVITHQRKVHLKEKHVSCPHCEYMFFDVNQLKKHLVRHNPVKIYECSFCKKKFPRLSTLRQHEKIHTGDKRKVCPLCGERFVQKASLNYHMTKHHPEAC